MDELISEGTCTCHRAACGAQRPRRGARGSSVEASKGAPRTPRRTAHTVHGRVVVQSSRRRTATCHRPPRTLAMAKALTADTSVLESSRRDL